jgi:hypothetical protein
MFMVFKVWEFMVEDLNSMVETLLASRALKNAQLFPLLNFFGGFTFIPVRELCFCARSPHAADFCTVTYCSEQHACFD